MKKLFRINQAYLIIISIFILLFPLNSFTQSDETSEKTDSVRNGKKSSYEKFLEPGVIKDEGLFTIYRIDDKTFLEINDKLLGKDMLLASRISELSSTSKVVAGEMRKSPILVRFSRDNKNIYMHQIVSDYISNPEDAISVSVERNTIPPILNTFAVEALNSDSTAAVFDVTKFFSNEIPSVSPFNAKYKAGKLENDATFILEAKSYPQNVEVKTQMSYSNIGKEPFLVIMNRSFLLLPEEAMRPRYEDPRIGYFAHGRRFFSSDRIGVETLKYISRFDINPKPEDLQKYKSGELVEPAKPIVFYIDNAFPEQWRPYIKAGIEDWQIAFEAIGFENAIIAKDYPTDDPDFNPEDIRYSCIRYISMPKANSMGPRWIDPRSGEVIGGDVLWWHNVTELLRDWRFVQTAASDPAARKRNPDLEILGEMIRYVAAHELGHVLGLKHNMRASYAFPVDSLRSATFTQAYGTTPSIMDYARFNYIAQPGDEGIRYTPPYMGPYDIFAIKWGYQPIFEAESPEAEKSVLNKWILDKADEIYYRYGDQQMGLAFDPSSQNEALGDDAVKASQYGVKNAKFIMNHLVEWTTEKNGDFDYLTHMYKELLKQYNRYFGHVGSYLGGVYIYKLVEGEDKEYFNPVSESKQKEALSWLFKELKTQHTWILNPEIEKRIGTQKHELLKSQSQTMDLIMSPVILQRLLMYHTDYTPLEYLDDVFDKVWEKTKKSESLNDFDKQMQAAYVLNLISIGNSAEKGAQKIEIPEEDVSLGNPSASKLQPIDVTVKPLIIQKLRETKKLLKKNFKQKDPVLSAHYRYLYGLI